MSFLELFLLLFSVAIISSLSTAAFLWWDNIKRMREAMSYTDVYGSVLTEAVAKGDSSCATAVYKRCLDTWVVAQYTIPSYFPVPPDDAKHANRIVKRLRRLRELALKPITEDNKDG